MSVDFRECSESGEVLSDSQWRLPQTRPPVPRHVDRSSDITSESRIQTIPFGPGAMVRVVSPPPWLDALLPRISELGDLEEGWDSYGAQPIDPSCAVAAVKFLRFMLDASTPQPSIVPTANGGIQLEWHRAGADLEIEIDSPARLHVFFEDDQTGNKTEVTLAGNWKPLVPFLERIKATH